MSVKRFLLAGGLLSLAASSADAALTFSLERVASNVGAAGPSTVLLVARDSAATANLPISSLVGRFTDQTSSNGLKFAINSRSGDYLADGGVGTSTGYDERRPLIKGSFLFVLGAAVNVADGEAPGGNPSNTSDNVTASNDPRYASGLWFADFTSSRTSNDVVLASELTGLSGAVLGAAVVGALDEVTFTGGKLLAEGQPDIVIPNLSTAAVPEPAGLCFLGVLGAGTLLRRRRTA